MNRTSISKKVNKRTPRVLRFTVAWSSPDGSTHGLVSFKALSTTVEKSSGNGDNWLCLMFENAELETGAFDHLEAFHGAKRNADGPT